MTEHYEQQLRGGIWTSDPRLDRVPSYDQRSRAYPYAAAPRPSAAKRGSNQPARPTLDQGSEGACVGFSIATAMNASPRRHDPPLNADHALGIYKHAQQIDDWPGDSYSGTSVLAGLKVAKERGLISSYAWCFTIEEVVRGLDERGVLFGIPIYRSMLDPLPGGLLEVDPSSGVAGYHAIYGVDHRDAPIPGQSKKKQEHAVLQNTWGRWGGMWFKVPGHCFIKTEDLADHLLPRAVYGEAAVLIEAH